MTTVTAAPKTVESAMLKPAQRIDLRLVAPAVTTWLLALIGTTAGFELSLPVVLIILWVSALIAFIFVVHWLRFKSTAITSNSLAKASKLIALNRVWFRNLVALTLVLCSFGALTMTAIYVSLQSRISSPLYDAAQKSRQVEVAVVVLSSVRLLASYGQGAENLVQRVQFDGMLSELNGQRVSPIAVRVALPQPVEPLAFGGTVGLRAKVRQSDTDEDTAFQLTANIVPVVRPPPPIFAWAGTLREGLQTAAAALSGDGAELLPGLAIGDTTAVSEELDLAMKQSSLSHLTAVSGANCSLVTAAVFIIFGWFRAPRLVRILGAFIALCGFVLLVTPQASVVRAAAMAIVVLIALMEGRPASGVPALALAVLVLLVTNPWYARDYGFALSVAATAGLLVLTRPISVIMQWLLPRALATLLAIPISAQLACQPILVLLDPAIASYGVVVNLLAVPAATATTVLGLLACLLNPVLPSFAFGLLQLAWLPASWIAALAKTGSTLPLARLPWPNGVFGFVLICVIVAAVVVLLLSRRRVPRLISGVAVLLGMAIPLGASVLAPRLLVAYLPRNWSIAMCDIGQGDAIFVRAQKQIALVDTGPDPARLERCRQLLGIERVQMLVLTHWDADHVQGSTALAGRVDLILHGPLDGFRSARILDPLVSAGAAPVQVHAGFHGDLGFAEWRVLWPQSSAAEPGNDASVTVEIRWPGFSAIFLGDLGEDAQRSLLSDGQVQSVDLVKVAHHGSADQYSELYRRLQAKLALIGVGIENGYGHPTERLLKILQDNDSLALRTDRSGTVVIVTDNEYLIWTERGLAG